MALGRSGRSNCPPNWRFARSMLLSCFAVTRCGSVSCLVGASRCSADQGAVPAPIEIQYDGRLFVFGTAVILSCSSDDVTSPPPLVLD